MSTGPSLIFDKSTLESLSLDESVWLETFFQTVITPLFFVETLADLEKEVEGGRTPAQVVGRMAEKTPSGGRPNLHHLTLCRGELSGQRIEMRRVPILAGGDSVTVGGVRTVRFKQAPEMDALMRWKAGQFLEVEREFAHNWRAALSNVDLQAVFRQGRETIARTGRPRDLVQARELAVSLLRKPGSRYAMAALEAILPAAVQARWIAAWKRDGARPLASFAPYTAHVATVDLFFSIALGADLISRDRPSNKVDVAYLYYLPFCMIFTSRDRLHQRCAEAFIGPQQRFVHGDGLKADLAQLDAYYSKLPEEVKEQGVMAFVHHPPTEGDFLVSQLWDFFYELGWREGAEGPGARTPKESDRALLDEVKRLTTAPADARTPGLEFAEPDGLVIEHWVPIKKGKWRMVPPGSETNE